MAIDHRIRGRSLVTRKATPQQTRVRSLPRTEASWLCISLIVYRNIEEEEKRFTYLLQLRRRRVIASGSFEVRAGEDEDGDSGEEEDAGEDGVGLEGED